MAPAVSARNSNSSRYSLTFLSEPFSRITPTNTALFEEGTLTELEDHREGVGNLYGAVPLLARLPLRGAGNDADGFLVE